MAAARHGVVAGQCQQVDDMAADEAVAAADQNAHGDLQFLL